MPEGPEEKSEMESAVKANNLKAGNAQLSEQYLAQDLAKASSQGHAKDSSQALLNGQVQGSASQIKINLALKVVVFCSSVVTLSWFFEGTRQCKDAATPQGLSYLIGGTLLTLLLVALQAFFIYCEERSKGLRTRKVALFDKWYLLLVSKQEGDYTNRV